MAARKKEAGKSLVERLKGISWKVLVLSLIIVYLAALIGSLFTSSSVKSEWYQQIKPGITPPSYIFPIVWNILFFLIALSLYFAWTNSRNKSDRKKIAGVFAANLMLNVLWSALFFGMKNPLAGFIDIILLWLSIIFMIAATWKISRASAYLLIPYFLWVSFAAVLNYLAIS
ncbi:MAG TPA: TspO/MBR family protein [Candidatus Nanoarchaeia archaeon]|nr:TspO/MBR family protein [Candidatus Nanoarchaeia archaeon]